MASFQKPVSSHHHFSSAPRDHPVSSVGWAADQLVVVEVEGLYSLLHYHSHAGRTGRSWVLVRVAGDCHIEKKRHRDPPLCLCWRLYCYAVNRLSHDWELAEQKQESLALERIGMILVVQRTRGPVAAGELEEVLRDVVVELLLVDLAGCAWLRDRNRLLVKLRLLMFEAQGQA